VDELGGIKKQRRKKKKKKMTRYKTTRGTVVGKKKNRATQGARNRVVARENTTVIWSCNQCGGYKLTRLVGTMGGADRGKKTGRSTGKQSGGEAPGTKKKKRLESSAIRHKSNGEGGSGHKKEKGERLKRRELGGNLRRLRGIGEGERRGEPTLVRAGGSKSKIRGGARGERQKETILARGTVTSKSIAYKTSRTKIKRRTVGGTCLRREENKRRGTNNSG